MPENQPNSIEIFVNGDRRVVPDGLSVQALLAHLGIEAGRVAVELNREIVRKPAWSEVRVDAGANVEIVQFVGGGVR